VGDFSENKEAFFGEFFAVHEGLERLPYPYVFRVVLCLGFPATRRYLAHVSKYEYPSVSCQLSIQYP
jgi:hypothetical protein